MVAVFVARDSSSTGCILFSHVCGYDKVMFTTEFMFMVFLVSCVSYVPGKM